ncbi:CoA-binding protein [candidate division WOR-3 bacterium]|nr:CoA-binding protein [candidate division WOR-3 bacterium]
MISGKNIALVGASKNREKFGNALFRYLKMRGYNVYPVNRNGGIIENTRAYRTIEELPEGVDLVVFVVPKNESFEVLKKAVELGHKKFWFQPNTLGKDAEKYLAEIPHLKYTAGRCIMTET